MSQIPGYGCEDVSPKGFVSLMDLYESNYIKLRKLMPAPWLLENSTISKAAGHLDLYLKITERSDYTTTLYMSYCFPTGSGLKMEPNLKVRVYHDAQQAEVLAGHLHHGRWVLDKLPAKACRERWLLNRFFNRWLGYCLGQGHSFAPFIMESKAAISRQIQAVSSSDD